MLVFFGDFKAFFAADFLAAGVFAAEDILSNKKGCWQPGLSSMLSVTECLVASFSPPCRKMINITTLGNEESLRKWFLALLESCLLLSREIGEPWNDERLCGWLAKSRQSASHAYYK
jgi:hypothetical protein